MTTKKKQTTKKQKELKKPVAATMLKKVRSPKPEGHKTKKEIQAIVGNRQLSQAGMRYMVDEYYQLQDYRKASSNQLSAISRRGEPEQPLTEDIHGQIESIEKQIQMGLEQAANNSEVGRWAMSIPGIGPVISAALLAHIDISQCPTAGHIWRFAGLDPTQNWLGREKADAAVKEAVEAAGGVAEAIPSLASIIGTRPETLLKLASTTPTGDKLKLTAATLAKAAAKRPWNANLKTLCWKIGESFVKVSGQDDDIYGKLYLKRKLFEQERNMKGELKEQAAAKLQKYRIGKDTDAYKYYSKGLLPPAHIHARAKRWTVKLFLAHWQWVAWESTHGEPPVMPYVIDQLKHVHLISPPNWETKWNKGKVKKVGA